MKTLALVLFFQTCLNGQALKPAQEPFKIIPSKQNIFLGFQPLDSETGYVTLASTLSMQVKQEVSRLTFGGMSFDKKPHLIKLTGRWHLETVLMRHKTSGYIIETRLGRHADDSEQKNCRLEKEEWFSAQNQLEPLADTSHLAQKIAVKTVEFLKNQTKGEKNK